DVLADHHREPALNREKIRVLAQDAPVTAEEIELLPQTVGERHIPAMLPERAAAVRLRIVHEHEVAYAFELELEDLVIAVDVRLLETLVREEAEQHGDAALNEVDARCFERLQKP